MAKSTKLASVVVEVDIKKPHTGARRYSDGVLVEGSVSAAWNERAQGVAKKLRALVDSDMLEGAAWVFVQGREEHTCSECGSPWTESSATFNGGCCDADMANEPVPAPSPEARP